MKDTRAGLPSYSTSFCGPLVLREAQLVDLFSKLDTRKTGYLTLTAFFNGLELLREYMSDEELELVCLALVGPAAAALLHLASVRYAPT